MCLFLALCGLESMNSSRWALKQNETDKSIQLVGIVQCKTANHYCIIDLKNNICTLIKSKGKTKLFTNVNLFSIKVNFVILDGMLGI